jgi:hypothetical protein
MAEPNQSTTPNIQEQKTPGPANPPETKSAEKEGQTESLYSALQRVGVYNITTLMKRLDISVKDEKAAGTPGPTNLPTAPTSPTSETYTATPRISQVDKVHTNATQLLKLMGLSTNVECTSMIEKICLQGKEMLGEIAKPTLTSAPLSTGSSAGKQNMETQSTKGKESSS